MRIPIAHALFSPNHAPLPFPKASFFWKTLTFDTVDEERFPSILFAREALKRKRCREMNQANEKSGDRIFEWKNYFLRNFDRVRSVIYEE